MRTSEKMIHASDRITTVPIQLSPPLIFQPTCKCTDESKYEHSPAISSPHGNNRHHHFQVSPPLIHPKANMSAIDATFFLKVKQPPKPLTQRYLQFAYPSKRKCLTSYQTPPENHHHLKSSLYPSTNLTSPYHPPKHAPEIVIFMLVYFKDVIFFLFFFLLLEI